MSGLLTISHQSNYEGVSCATSCRPWLTTPINNWASEHFLKSIDQMVDQGSDSMRPLATLIDVPHRPRFDGHTSCSSRVPELSEVGPSSLTFAGSNLQEVVTTDSTNAGCADDLPRVVIVISVCCDGDFSDIDRSGACSLSVVVSVGTGSGLRRALCGQTTQSLRGSWEASQQIGGFLVAGSNRCSW